MVKTRQSNLRIKTKTKRVDNRNFRNSCIKSGPDDSHYSETSESDNERPRIRKCWRKKEKHEIPRPIDTKLLHCPLCTKTCEMISKLIKHLRRHELPGGFKCWYCREQFCFEQERAKHTEQDHETIPCRICYEKFDNENNYLQHIQHMHNGDEAIACHRTVGQTSTTTLSSRKRRQQNKTLIGKQLSVPLNQSVKAEIVGNIDNCENIREEPSITIPDLAEESKNEKSGVPFMEVETEDLNLSERVNSDPLCDLDLDYSKDTDRLCSVPEDKNIVSNISADNIVRFQANDDSDTTVLSHMKSNLNAKYSKLKSEDASSLSHSKTSKESKKRKKNHLPRYESNQLSRILTSKGSIQCENCPKKYLLDKAFIKHMVRDHNYDELEVRKKFTQKPKGVIINTKLICKICTRQFTTAYRLRLHVRIHGPNGDLIHRCKMCRENFRTTDDMREHGRIQHADKTICKICNRSYHTHDGLQSHIRYKHTPNFEKRTKKGKKPFICQKCGISFANRNTLIDHEGSDCGQNPIYKCDDCGNFYKTDASLRTHKLIHSGLKRFVCSQCGEAFTTGGQLTVHNRRHTGEKPFKCQVCSKSFSHRETFLTHVTSHTGIKRFMCNNCGDRFSCISGLQSHRKARIDSCGALPLVSKAVAGIKLDNTRVFTGLKSTEE